MATQTALIPGAEPFSADGGRVGVLLSHGFTGSPVSMKPWGRMLAAQGFSVRVPLLPGHGTHWRELNTTVWQDWYAALERSLDELCGSCDRVAVAGLSMGGSLALRLAANRPADVGAIVVVNPTVNIENRALPWIKYLRHVLPAVSGIAGDIKKPGVTEAGYRRMPLRALYSQTELWADTRRSLPQVKQPLLYFRSLHDHVVDDSSTEIIMENVGSSLAQLRILHNSYHVATLDNDASQIFEESLEFLIEHVGRP